MVYVRYCRHKARAYVSQYQSIAVNVEILLGGHMHPFANGLMILPDTSLLSRFQLLCIRINPSYGPQIRADRALQQIQRAQCTPPYQVTQRCSCVDHGPIVYLHMLWPSSI